jgi:hypothetical protein
MASLPNYLVTSRKRLALSQEEVAFLLGYNGESRGCNVCRDESFDHEPSLRAAIAYEMIYGRPMRELFAGLYEEVEKDLAQRAKLLGFRTSAKSNEKLQHVINSLMAKTDKKNEKQ